MKCWYSEDGENWYKGEVHHGNSSTLCFSQVNTVVFVLRNIEVLFEMDGISITGYKSVGIDGLSKLTSVFVRFTAPRKKKM